jgi:hypothetical protein
MLDLAQMLGRRSGVEKKFLFLPLYLHSRLKPYSYIPAKLCPHSSEAVPAFPRYSACPHSRFACPHPRSAYIAVALPSQKQA